MGRGVPRGDAQDERASPPPTRRELQCNATLEK
jgi:hypothetical protein